MFGNYPVNDDWIFVSQVEAFSQGIFTLNAELDPSFIAQGFLGLLWGKIFGISFVNLQILTFLITIIAVFVFIQILKEFNVKKPFIIFFSLLLFFNPIIFVSAFTFMTENYYLLFFLGSTYFYIMFLQNQNKILYLILGSILVLVSILIRQIGALIGFSLILVLLFDIVKRGKLNRFSAISIIMLLALVIFSLLITLLWPRFNENRKLILNEQLITRIKFILLSLHYFPLFIFPVLAGLNIKILDNKFITVILIPIFIFILIYLYNFDIYPVGNVFYLEELYSKSDFRSAFSLFDNILFKSLFVTLTAFCITKFIVFFLERIRRYKSNLSIKNMNSVNQFLIILGVSNFIILLFSSDYYDRYLIPSFICLFILIIRNFAAEIKINKLSIFCLIMAIFIVIFLQWEFSAKNRLMWDQARKLSEKTGYFSQISLNDTYTNYIITKKENDFTGLIERKSFEKKCYVQDYSVESDSNLFMSILNLEDYIDVNILEKKKPYLVNKKEGFPKVKKHLDNLIYNQEYFSFLFNFVGKRAFVASWCNENI
ncbi:hypothetical protein A3F07_03685 [candidate division WWE3 bacterium RIFCSPHIGHO2_12_FULL_38_15]|uniref:Uncharacterized protein n=1 Tax=candidate division WWE3 bacterium RIFCSPHIGHO2_02_FULL_38_14 TaxID=1802620 RepID=A0A1F4V7S8_UNCKA|nr:MAG: hypothetical protein A2793_02295 [candidate division WWE3 bacterium RIFCSPHIGHO2_01_FULL_38_45]OGC48922.1 MAG: hypothetical protein A3F07_03685 [candidate division WWE3 bacterium RIFCSPHIGHO2_12_FULL_38_15]OGC52971.1 MAG: hypothetical protein A3B64_04920 [candidate division WWE3 bacterium RIFCSPLOWO2_01_FULL_37_24]OGC53228.1 MAG: hypothetical protein A3D91_02280 [candidate division WWE3 bacterium RIFCSPHIGHO2_02_FULL_38_14]